MVTAGQGDGDVAKVGTDATPSSPAIGSSLLSGDGNVREVSGSARLRLVISKPKVIRGSAMRLRVRVSQRGRLTVRGPWIRNLVRRVGKAGAQQVRVPLTRRAKKVLQRRGRLTVNLRIVARGAGGLVAFKRTSVVVKQPKSNRAKTRKGGR